MGALIGAVDQRERQEQQPGDRHARAQALAPGQWSSGDARRGHGEDPDPARRHALHERQGGKREGGNIHDEPA